MKSLLHILIAITFCSAPQNSIAQELSDRDEQLHEISDKIRKYYVFKHVADSLATKLEFEVMNKTFANLNDKEFADSISKYLVKNSNDRHFNVLFRPNFKETKQDEKKLLKLADEINKQWNYGFEKVQRIDGNIGYIQYTGFPEGNKPANEILAATMNFVSNTNALIIDLRQNHGGDGKMVELFLSYFFDEKIELGTSYTRYNDKLTTSYTRNKVKGKRYLNKPVYILVDNRTISAAEGFAYDMQKYRNAVIIGERTYGAANPIKVFFIGKLYHLFIPISENKNTKTNSNWEHNGVDLDVKIISEKALIKAHIMALQNLVTSNTITELTIEEMEVKVKLLEIELKR